MGTWGPGIRDNDAVCDMIDEFEELLRAGKSIREATREMLPPGSDTENSYDDLLIRLALADMQWTYGDLDPELRERVTHDIEAGHYIEGWEEAGADLLRKRRSALRYFAKKIRTPKGCPKKVRRKPTRRRPRFALGDCLSVRVSDTHFVAAYVLDAGVSGEWLGSNMVGVLDYIAEEPPSLDDFRERRYRRQTDYEHRDCGWLDVSWFEREKGAQDHIEVIGNLPKQETDPTRGATFNPWWFLGQNARQCFDAGGPFEIEAPIAKALREQRRRS